MYLPLSLSSNHSLSLYLSIENNHPPSDLGGVAKFGSPRGPDWVQNTPIIPFIQYLTHPPSFPCIFTPKSLKKHRFLAILQCNPRLAWGWVTGRVPPTPQGIRLGDG